MKSEYHKIKVEPKMVENNLINSSLVPAMFKNPAYRFEASSRMIIPDIDAMDYLKIYYMYLDIAQIHTVFGNAAYPSRFYGGRTFDLEHSLTDEHVRTLNEHGKGVTFTLTNHNYSEDVYQANQHFLKKHHRQGNAIVCTNDELAEHIREDFPEYKLKASLIKNLNTVEKVEKALDIYDRVVIPMDKNDDDAFLQALPEKERIVLFATANCAYNCVARTCYAAISQVQWGKEKKSKCSKAWLPRENLGHSFFNIDKFASMGFNDFKLVPNITPQSNTLVDMHSKTSQLKRGVMRDVPQQAVMLYSFPKCGRTWLRILLAHYFNLAFKLEVPVDLQSIFTMLPNDHGGLKGVEHFQFDHVTDMPLVVSSHGLDKEQKGNGILLLRSIPDVVVSDYFQHQKLGLFEGSITEFLAWNKGSLNRYCDYLNAWAKDKAYAEAEQYVLTYEALHQDTCSELKRILQFLGLSAEEDKVSQAVDAAAFGNMQQAEKTSGHAGMSKVKGNTELLKVRKGVVGGYVNYLSPDEIKQTFTVINSLLSKQAKEMMVSLGIADGFDKDGGS